MGDSLECLECILEVLALDGRLGPHHRRLDLGVLVPGLARLQIRSIDTEPLGDPPQRLGRRARLAALDLADVLLGETIAGQIRLGQARGDAQLSQSGTKSRRDTLRRDQCEGAAFHGAALRVSASLPQAKIALASEPVEASAPRES